MTQPFTDYATTVLDVLSRTPGRTVLTGPDGRHVTAGEFRDAVYRMAGELADRGIGRGATVSLLTGNTPGALGARYAANLAGARVVFLYDGMAPEALARIVESTETTALVVDSLRHADAEGLLPLVTVPSVLTLGPAPFGEDLLARSARRAARRPEPVVGPDDDYAIRYTGGTTGIPKGIRLAHGSYRRSMDAPRSAMGDPPRHLACTPLGHLAGMFADWCLVQGGSVVLLPGFDAGEVLAAIERERITHVWLVPPLLYRLLDHPDRAATDLSSLSRITYGGAAASATRLREALDAFGPVLYGVYGQSETLAIAEVAPQEHTVTGRDGQITVGRPLPGVEVTIRDGNGALLPAGRKGEITVRSDGVMRGYWKQPGLTAEVVQDGRVRTDDVGYLDGNGYLFVVDRIKDMIIVVGGHVYPAELEELLLTHPDVAACVAFGVRGADETEQVHVAIVPVAGHRIDPGALGAFVATHKGPMYVPGAVHVVEAVPLTTVGKPDRKAAREQLGL
ncbi:AMP-binding protein [Streptomyces sp. NPDC001404]|uniref:AMP-binding protein n=1 Tax=Streptomyces sp. NPDC001404 TaxID=3364571 RepID=UPI0036C0CC78